MSNINRAIKRRQAKVYKVKHHTNSNMVNISMKHKLSSKFTVNIVSYNKNIFSNAKMLLMAYELFFDDLIDYMSIQSSQQRVIDFLQDSIQNNYMLDDTLTEKNFEIKEDHILFENDGDEKDYINNGEFHIDNYRVNVCYSYMFFEDLKSGKKYIYYGD